MKEIQKVVQKLLREQESAAGGGGGGGRRRRRRRRRRTNRYKNIKSPPVYWSDLISDRGDIIEPPRNQIVGSRCVML